MKKGFTLIELLAVIVILAIIALIATPIVLNIISDSKESSVLRSAEMYLDAVEYAVADTIMNNKIIPDGTYNVLENGNICLTTLIDGICNNEMKIEVNGQIPDSLSSITILNSKINKINLIYGKKAVVKDEKQNLIYKKPVCNVISGDGMNPGNEIECKGEYFYIIKNDGKKISMLAKYNLNVGDNTYADGIIGIQNENVAGYKSGMSTRGIVVFSLEDYWTNGNYKPAGDSSYNYIYDNNSSIYEYVESYEMYLKENGVNSASGKLISYEQLVSLGCGNGTCTSSKHDWVYSTTYWSGSHNTGIKLWSVGSLGNFDSRDYNYLVSYGVRPVIEMSVSEI